MDEEAFKTAMEGLTRQLDVQARQVANGFILTGNARYIQPGTVQVSKGCEAVAMDAGDASAKLSHFLANGDFE